MERTLLGVFCLAGLHIFSSGLPHQYHYIDESLNWTEAQTYCREKYTDLVTIENTEDMNQLNNTVSTSGYNYEVWVGLYGSVDWRWSDGYNGSEADYSNWGPDEPDDQSCVMVGKSGNDSYSWWDHFCESLYPFFCYEGPQQDPRFHFIDKCTNWSSAQRYCRENYTDLATVKNIEEDKKIQSLMKENWAWIGLFRSPGFTWSDGSSSSFRNWENVSKPSDSAGVTDLCGAVNLEGSQTWNLSHCGRRLPFVCYGAPKPPGLHIFSSGLPHQYHYVDESLNWTQAQTYCREKYTDLVTIENTEDMNQLNNTVSTSGYNYEVWIGLYGSVDWRWSDGYNGSEADYRNWGPNEPDDHLCVAVEKSGIDIYSWVARDCTLSYYYICNEGGTLEDPSYMSIPEKKSWSDAQSYCGKIYHNLATVKNDKDNAKIHLLVDFNETAWIGLFGRPSSSWSDGSNSTFRDWVEGSDPAGFKSAKGLCGAVNLEGSQKWNLSRCERRLPFVCYGAPKPAVKNHVIKLRMKPDDPSVNLNDPAVRAQILEELQDKLKENKVSGVSLKWREQPAGNVFLKEMENPQKKLGKKTEF